MRARICCLFGKGSTTVVSRSDERVDRRAGRGSCGGDELFLQRVSWRGRRSGCARGVAGSSESGAGVDARGEPRSRASFVTLVQGSIHKRRNDHG